ncbi:MAG: ribonuclease H family protein, partial [Planctomycetota bacterium]
LDAGEVPWKVAVVDRFAAREPVKALIAPAHPGLQVVEVPRAEQHLAVAAASVLARESFLRQMDELRDRFACELPLGSGAPVPPALRRFREVHGDDVLGQAAKLHFKNVQRFLES